MPSRRDVIRMTDEEVQRFLEDSKTIILNSIGPDGVPHPMPMWYGVEDDGAIVMTTFAKSQKVRNLERDARVSLLVEAGEQYDQLRGVVFYGKAELIRDTEAVLDVLSRVTGRMGGGAAGDAPPEALRDALRKTAEKRVAIRVRPERVVSWDHRKLGGVY
ncbi:MAG: TIGR03618 family F420-dependent PPOX class oxidoreductase [Myxococcota bacterium]|nr:TIGR03618 family F420-dependent PPOX class oxidoreductase [Myxococcota bacterium]